LVAHTEGRTRLSVFENKMLRERFEPRMDEVPGDWRKLHIEELYNLYSSQNIIWVIKKSEMGGACGTYGELHAGFCGAAWRKETTWKT
jgi:hypothetical protein